MTHTHTHTPRTFQKVIRSGARDMNGELPPEVWDERDVAATLSDFDLGSESRAVDLVVQPAAIRGRDDGAELELGDPGDPAHSLRTPGGGSSLPLVCITGERTHSLTAEGHDAGEDGTGRGTPIVVGVQTQDPISGETSPALSRTSVGMGVGIGMQVRRLTPTECGRLQGFPDGHTDTSFGKPQTDSPRYKQYGNAEAVPVVEWILVRLIDVDGAR